MHVELNDEAEARLHPLCAVTLHQAENTIERTQ